MDDQAVEPTEPAAQSETYEPPKIERVMTTDDLTREIQYAGNASEVSG